MSQILHLNEGQVLGKYTEQICTYIRIQADTLYFLNCYIPNCFISCFIQHPVNVSSQFLICPDIAGVLLVLYLFWPGTRSFIFLIVYSCKPLTIAVQASKLQHMSISLIHYSVKYNLIGGIIKINFVLPGLVTVLTIVNIY